MENKNELEERKINVTLKDGKTVEGEILFTFDANGDDFVLYEINKEVFAAKVNENNELSAVEEDEWPLIEKVFNEYQDSLEEEEEEE
ncbi:MAG: DUF1292 domain-containing protein [Mycoplasma sp.]|nr:DUF1292 domain-containing protein [Mycoplasma sp.]